MIWRRRDMMLLLAATACAIPFGATGAASHKANAGSSPFAPVSGPRGRVILVNDLSGDVDGLFATVHAILSPSIDLRAIVGTTTGNHNETTEAAVARGQEMVRLTGRAGKLPVHAGAHTKLAAADQPIRSAGTQAIIDEAMRTDTNLPLYVAVGGGLTEVASALMLQPSIAERMTLVWIGGVLPSDTAGREYNYSIDPLAARFVFNQTTVPIWQVPRDTYATCVVSITELQARVAPQGRIGDWLYRQMLEAKTKMTPIGINTGETWTLGDNPLVLLTALTDWVPSRFGQQARYERTGSSLFVEQPTPLLDQSGRPQARQSGRPIRIYRSIDSRVMLEDFYAKLQMNKSR